MDSRRKQPDISKTYVPEEYKNTNLSAYKVVETRSNIDVDYNGLNDMNYLGGRVIQEIMKAEDKILSDIAEVILGRKPSKSDCKNFSRCFNNESSNKFSGYQLRYKDQILGYVKYHISVNKCSVSFEPVTN